MLFEGPDPFDLDSFKGPNQLSNFDRIVATDVTYGVVFLTIKMLRYFLEAILIDLQELVENIDDFLPLHCYFF